MTITRKPTDGTTPEMVLGNLAATTVLTVWDAATKIGHRARLGTLREWLVARLVPPGTAGRVLVTNGAGGIADGGVLLEELGGGAPAAHAASHATGSSDPITPASIGAATVAEAGAALTAAQNAQTTADMSYCTAYDWTPTLASEDASLTNGASCAAFIGEGGSTTVGVVHGALQGTLTPDAAGDVSFTATLPASADEAVYVSGYANSSSAILIGGLIVGSAMSLSFVSPDTDPYVFFVNFTYRTGVNSPEDDDMAYVLSGTYEPEGTINGSADFGVLDGDGEEGLFGFLRAGAGPGPRAGDTVTAWGCLNLFNVDNGGTLSVALPFLANIPAAPAPDIRVECTAAGCSVTSAEISMGAQLQLTLATPGADHYVGAVPVRITYQTANAIDP